MNEEEQKKEIATAKLLPRVLPQNPLLRHLPKHLKDPKNYEKVMKAIIEAGASKHSHGEVGEWAVCEYCQKRESNRLLMMKALGFSSGKQYLAWRKVQEYIRTKMRVPFEKYNS